ncbi:MAG TPA: prephenate dehydrogenase/arogenate dehydrogenase family protein [Candidatus Limnocylindrales bacterium]
MRIAFLGFGLIGGSVARSLRSRSAGWSIAAWSPSGNGPRTAAEDGTIDLAAPDPAAALAGADLVVLAAPPLECLALLDDLAGPLADALPRGAIVTDVASTKRSIAARARDRGLPFVGGHPMAGRETAGYGAADEALFVGRPWVICDDGAASRAVALVERLARDVGARPLLMDAATHDAAVAAVSHLPLVLSAALVEAMAPSASRAGDSTVEHAATLLAASGWRDMTRLARGDATMAAGIAATNADLLAIRIRDLRDALDGWLAELERPGGSDAARLTSRFAAAQALAGDRDGAAETDR